MIATTAQLFADGVIAPLDFHFAQTMAGLVNEQQPEVLLALAVASRYVNRGHVCVDLKLFNNALPLVDIRGQQHHHYQWPDLDQWLQALRLSPLVDEVRQQSPLVLDSKARLYLQRYWQHQQQLIWSIRQRTNLPQQEVDGAWLRSTLARLFSVGGPEQTSSNGTGSAETKDVTETGEEAETEDVTETEETAAENFADKQRLAAFIALTRKLAIITGGPGTGKTYTVAKLLALVLEDAVHRKTALPRITLVAPTGKAAARLVESIKQEKNRLQCSPQVLAAIPEHASTIHRALGSIAGRSTQFRHNADNPMHTDVVLVDEASMVDIGLMRRLFDATPGWAKMIMLGDQDQLASVEVGAVLGDLCHSGAHHNYSQTLQKRVAEDTGMQLQQDPKSSPQRSGIWDNIVHLRRSFRYRENSGIGRLAKAIKTGDSQLALGVLQDPDFADVCLVQPSYDGTLGQHLRRQVISGYQPYLTHDGAAEQLALYANFRVLCAHRRGYLGVEMANGQIGQALEQSGLLNCDKEFYVGRPIMVTRNDYNQELFNGDVGLIRKSTRQGESQEVACFISADGTNRRFAPTWLPPHETVFAMTVHKSQGSEFDKVAVLLPEHISPVLSRELLYTAVTRARQKVTIYASPGIISQAIRRRINRASGLREALWQRQR